MSLQVGKPIDFDNNGNISSMYVTSVNDQKITDIILLSMINSQPIPETEYPTTLPDGRITVLYGATGYPYELWFYDNYIIFGNKNNTYRKITNDHNDPVPLIKELVGSISTTIPG